MTRSAMERLRRGERVTVGTSDVQSVEVGEDAVWIHGCDCSGRLSVEGVKELHEALGAWLRIQRANESRP